MGWWTGHNRNVNLGNSCGLQLSQWPIDISTKLNIEYAGKKT